MVSAKLQKLINELELNPEEFADVIGVGKSSVYKLLRGDTKKVTKKFSELVNKAYPQFSIKYLLSFNNKTTDTVLNYKDEKQVYTLTEAHKRIITDAFLLNEKEVKELPIVKKILKAERLEAENNIMKQLANLKK